MLVSVFIFFSIWFLSDLSLRSVVGNYLSLCFIFQTLWSPFDFYLGIRKSFGYQKWWSSIVVQGQRNKKAPQKKKHKSKRGFTKDFELEMKMEKEKKNATSIWNRNINRSGDHQRVVAWVFRERERERERDFSKFSSCIFF